MARTVAARRVIDFGRALHGVQEPHAITVSADGAIFAAGRTAMTDYRVVRALDDETRIVDVRDEPLQVSFIQPIRDGLLLASPWSDVLGTDPSPNAIVVDWHGERLRRFSLGQGIADVRVAHDDTVWAAYFDEGVYGSDPTSSCGLVGFDATGATRFRYDRAAAKTGPINDVYALNVGADGSAWIYFHSDFPIVRITAAEYRAWTCGVAGARALAIRGDRALLVGEYGDGAVARIFELGTEGAARLLETVKLRNPGGPSLDEAEVHAAGDKVYFAHATVVGVLDDW